MIKNKIENTKEFDCTHLAQERFNRDIAAELYKRFISLADESNRQAQDHKENNRDTAYARARGRACQAQECANDIAVWFSLRKCDL